MLIAIASSAEERIRVATLFGAHATVLLVSSREEAIALLTAADAGPAPGESPARTQDDACDPGLVLDSDWRTASWRGRSVPLSPLEHDLLHCLLSDLGHTWTFAELHQHVWGNAHLGDRSDMQSVVKRLRRKLGFLGSPLRVQAIRGVGFRLVQPLHAVGLPDS